MPFARWDTFDDCVLEQQELGHTEDAAAKICGAIQHRAEKGVLFKSEPHHLDILAKSASDLIVGGYASWDLVDPQNDRITTKAQVKFLKKLFAEPEPYRNIMMKHGNFQIGTPLLTYHHNGTTLYSHVNEIGTYLIAKIRDSPWRSVQKARADILQGKLKMYSISGDPIQYTFRKEHGDTVREIYDIDPWEVTLCEKGVNPKAVVHVLSKASGNPCDTETCGGACCTFVTEWSNRNDADLKKYLQLHGVETKDHGSGMWLKYPVTCKAFNTETQQCMEHDRRPDICKAYPRRESPFISKAICNLQQSPELRKQQVRDWMLEKGVFLNKSKFLENCIPRVSGLVKDPEAFCGAFWQDKDQWYHGPVKTELHRDVVKHRRPRTIEAPPIQSSVSMEEIFTRNWRRYMK